jgi:hypothetical protein
LIKYMSSGLPINTLSQAAEYRKRYLATLALEAQNDAYNLQANQVYKQTGQPSRPPDTRTTTEKLADIEKLKVDLRAGLLQLTDGEQAAETIEQLTPDEVMFATQQLPAIIMDLKPKFARGVPANALVAYIRSLRRKFLATNGVSFTAQEATSQQILNAIQAGVTMLGANGGPFAVTGGATPTPQPTPPPTPPMLMPPNTPEDEFIPIDPAIEERTTPIRPMPIRPSPGMRPPSGLPIGRPGMSEEMMGDITEKAMMTQFNNDQMFKQAARNFGPEDDDQWAEYPTADGFAPYPTTGPIAVQFLKWWAAAQPVEIQLKFQSGWRNINSLPLIKIALEPGVEYKLAAGLPQEEQSAFEVETLDTLPSQATTRETGTDVSLPTSGIPSSAIFLERIGDPRFTQKQMTEDVTAFLTQAGLLDQLVRFDGLKISPKLIAYSGEPKARAPILVDDTNLIDLIRQVRGRGVTKSRAREPASRFPVGRHILGYGLKPPKKKAISVDMTKGLSYESAPTYIPLGRYIINPSKLSSGVFDMRTLKGGAVKKYPARQLSPQLTKVLNRILGGRMPDEYDFNEMELDDQHFLYGLANDAKIMDRLRLPTPKRTKDDEEEHRFEILKGMVIAGNDNKEMIKEFKTLLVKFSNEGRIKKTEAREILLDLASMGH